MLHAATCRPHTPAHVRDRTRRSRLRVPSIALLLVSLVLLVAPDRAAHASTGDTFTPQSRIGFHSGDDWEPALAADHFGHLYALYLHNDVAGGGTCTDCNRHLLVQRSDDGGRSWTSPRPIAAIPVRSGQFDPQIVVDPADGRTVWATFMQNVRAEMMIVKSTDFGDTWSAPRVVSDRPPGLDKDTLMVRGRTLVVAYDDNYNTWASVSLDGGEHWTTHLVFPGSNQFSLTLSAGGVIDSRGAFYISWNSFGADGRRYANGPVILWVSKSSDDGQTWTRTIIDVSGAPPPCPGCGLAYLSAQMAMAIGSDDTIYLLWNGTAELSNFIPERIFFARSTDHGATYSPRRQVSTAPEGIEHCFPALAVGQAPGDVRLSWMDTRTGAWNVFYRASKDGGDSFGPTLRISSYVPGYSYLTPQGFQLPYGDYYQMVVDNAGLTHLDFGEAPNYQGPGNIWVSNQVAG